MMLLPFYALLYFALLSCAEPAPAGSRPLIVNGTDYIPPKGGLLNPQAPTFFAQGGHAAESSHAQTWRPKEGSIHRINYNSPHLVSHDYDSSNVRKLTML